MTGFLQLGFGVGSERGVGEGLGRGWGRVGEAWLYQFKNPV